MTTANGSGQRGGNVALSITDLTKTFGGTRALDAVSFDVAASSVHALLGGNGSGKSTLIKILAGVYHGDAGGTINLGGQVTAAEHTSPSIARQAGLRFVHQNPGLFQPLTVADNIAIASSFPTDLGRINKRKLRRRAQLLLDRFEIAAGPDDILGDLRPADQTMIAIARALEEEEEEEGQSPISMLVLDEPTASLPDHEVEVLLAAIRRCAAAGETILYVSHRIEEVLAIADAVTVLRDGRHVVTRSARGLTEAELVQQIVGRPIQQVFAESEQIHAGDVALEVKNLAGGPLRDVSLSVRHGEILGIAGLLGSGRSELLRMIFGAYPKDAGEIAIDGTDVTVEDPAAAMRLGVAHVPENRELDAAFSDLSVRENIALGDIGKYRARGRINPRLEREAASASIVEFTIRASGDGQVFSSLSGGNQQKVVLARWLRRNPKILLLDEPTQGVDIGARADVYSSIRKAVDGGMAVVLVSSDFDELVHAADRVVVLREGRIVAEQTREQIDRNTITHLAYMNPQETAS